MGIESWIEHNPSPRKQASERAWDDHSKMANRILTFIQFWDSYRDSSITDESFSILFLNILRLHGDFTADLRIIIGDTIMVYTKIEH